MKSRHRCLIALGGNLGSVEKSFRNACSLLKENGVEVERLSSFYRTPPMGTDAGQEFLNAAAVVTSCLPAPDLLQMLHMIENRLGRKRTVHWGPRAIDLDLLLCDDVVLQQPDLVVPHPAMWYRRFVLEPAAEIAGNMNHPVLGESVGELWNRLRIRPLVFLVCAESATGQSAAAEGMETFGKDLIALEQICRRWNLEAKPEEVRFQPVRLGQAAASESFALIRLLIHSKPAESAINLSEAVGSGSGREFIIPFQTEQSARAVIQDIVIAALGADAVADQCG